jgi:hypothetical protein
MAAIPEVVAARRQGLERQLDPVLADGNTPEAVAKAQKLRDAWLGEVGGDGAKFREVLAATLKREQKKGGPADVGWCANPATLGGCAGEDVTAAVLVALKADKKFQKEVAAKVGVPK